MAAIGVDRGGRKHVLSLADGATAKKAFVPALLDDLVTGWLDLAMPRLLVVDGADTSSRRFG